MSKDTTNRNDASRNPSAGNAANNNHANPPVFTTETVNLEDILSELDALESDVTAKLSEERPDKQAKSIADKALTDQFEKSAPEPDIDHKVTARRNSTASRSEHRSAALHKSPIDTIGSTPPNPGAFQKTPGSRPADAARGASPSNISRSADRENSATRHSSDAGHTGGKPAKKKSLRALKAAALVILVALVMAIGLLVLLPLYRFHQANVLTVNGQYDEGIALYQQVAAQPIGRYLDTDARINEANYRKAGSLRESEQYDDAIALFETLGNYKDSAALARTVTLEKIDHTIEEGEFNPALDALAALDESYEGRDDLIQKAKLGRAQLLVQEGKVENAISELEKLGDYEGAQDALQEARYTLALDQLDRYDFKSAAATLTLLGDYKEAPTLAGYAASAFDAVYAAPFMDNAGHESDKAVSYLWVHSNIVPDEGAPALSMQEDFSAGDIQPQYFGSGMWNYVFYNQPDPLTFTFSYGGRELDSEQDREIALSAVFKEDYTAVTTEKVFADSMEPIEFPQHRAWHQVTDENIIHLVKDGFRAKMALNLARGGNPYFANATDEANVKHYCSATNCTNEGTLVVSDATSRAYYCEEHRAEYEADSRYAAASDASKTAAELNTADATPEATATPDAAAEGDASDPQADTAEGNAKDAQAPAVFKEDDDTVAFKSIDSDYAVLVNVDTGKIIAQRNAGERMYPASMTKVMTLLVAAEQLEGKNLNDTVTITDDILAAVGAGNLSAVGFHAGEVVTVRDCLWGTALPSGADAALALGRYVAGSDAAFVELMNRKANELGLLDTHFTNDIGADDDDHYTTALDMAVIMRAVTHNQLAWTILSTVQYTTGFTNDAHPAGITVSNRFLRRIASQDVPGLVFSAKTGYVSRARACSVSYEVADDGQHYICVTAGADNSWHAIYDHRDIYYVYTGKEAHEKRIKDREDKAAETTEAAAEDEDEAVND